MPTSVQVAPVMDSAVVEQLRTMLEGHGVVGFGGECDGFAIGEYDGDGEVVGSKEEWDDDSGRTTVLEQIVPLSCSGKHVKSQRDQIEQALALMHRLRASFGRYWRVHAMGRSKASPLMLIHMSMLMSTHMCIHMRL